MEKGLNKIIKNDYSFAGIFKRSVTVERINDSPYETEEEVSVYLDGKLKLCTKLNVFSIDGLIPDTEYSIRIGDVEKKFITKHESFLLDVKTFGAKGDGVSDDTSAIQAAILACPYAGTVLFSKGKYNIKPIFLKGDMTIWLEEGAELVGSPRRGDYPILPGMIRNSYSSKVEYNISSWEGNPLDSFASLITAIGVKNLDIVGPGVINGNADSPQADWWINEKTKNVAWRPKTIFFNNCEHVRMQNITVKNSPSWTIHPYYSNEMAFMNVSIFNPDNSPNTDGIDPESCSNFSLLGLRISVGDDCLAIKSGKLYMAQSHFKRTSHAKISNCLFERGHGSITFGSETACGVDNIIVEKCIFDNTDRGIRIKNRRGRGNKAYIDGINVSNIIMRNVLMPFTCNMFYFCDPDGHSDYVQNQGYTPVDERTPKIGHISFRHIHCTGVDACIVCAYGLPESPIEELKFEHITAEFLPKKEQHKVLPIMMDNFDEMAGKSFYLHNVKKLIMRDVNVIGSSDKEPEMISVKEKKLDNLRYC
ncbi:MAG: glycoside hydrolase family 28 protein [Eubacterium sp.]|nr:glycoside hydrolase family 28 protein [Eubacterium sp.]